MSLFSLNRAALFATSETAKYMKSVSPMFGLAKIGGFAKYCLMWVKARSHSSFHPTRLASLRVAKKGLRLSVDREINRPRAANRPVSYCIFFLELRAGDSKIV